jgi:NitT/TauT family transport system substrate-binding protein
MRNPIPKLTILIVLALVFTGRIGFGRQERLDAADRLEPITIAVTPWAGSAAIFIAHEEGYFKKEGLDAALQLHASGNLGLDALVSGKADLAAAGETPIARAVLNAKPVAVVATIAKVDRAVLIVARKDRGISAPGDLKGKKIGVVSGTTADFFLHIYLATSYIDPQEVRIVHIAPDSMVAALIDGEVDAVSTWAPHTIILQDELGKEAVVLQDSSIYTMTWNIAAKSETIRKHPDRIRKFLHAVIKANRFIAENPARARAIAAKHVGTESALFEREWKDYTFTAELDQGLILHLEDQARWMSGKSAESEVALPNFMEYIYIGALKSLQPEAVRIPGR